MYRLTPTMMIACLPPLLLTLSFSSAGIGLVAAAEQTGIHSSIWGQDQESQQVLVARGQKLVSWGGNKKDRQLGGKGKKGSKKAMGSMGKKGSPDCVGIDACNDRCFEFFEALGQTPPVEFCGSTCVTCSCKCADETCFNDCTCKSLEKAGFIEEAVAFGCDV
mmetsp:Transcript_3618/g.7539  ORF Transcript_3618/g.7539 Transcript_3618/m.7539 type:complete len:163 (-) Transcript_3618:28-516(-)